MKVTFKGNWNLNLLVEALHDVVSNTIDRLKSNVEEYSVKDADFIMQFKIAGMEEPQVITTNHSANKIPEIFTVLVDADSYMKNKSIVDNEDNLMIEDWVQVLFGDKNVDIPDEPIVSEYHDSDLELIEEIKGGDLIGKRSKLKTENGMEIVQYFKGEKLIAEAKIKGQE